MKSLSVVATIQAKSEHVEDVKAQLLTLIEPSRSDEGCLFYHLTDGENGKFVFVEQWENKAVLDAHLEQEHVKTVVAAIENWIESVDIQELPTLA